ncbi:hypothetical protein Lser_V15G06866 [Lactuca serriola]
MEHGVAAIVFSHLSDQGCHSEAWLFAEKESFPGYVAESEECLHEHIIIWLWFSGHGISAIRYATKHGLKKVVENLDATGVNVLAPYAVDQGLAAIVYCLLKKRDSDWNASLFAQNADFPEDQTEERLV